jgi:hypothetical protein
LHSTRNGSKNDPTYRIKYRPKYGGWKAWPDEMLDKFEAHWPIGTTPRLVYSLALYFGHRRSDVTKVRAADFKAFAHNVVQQKTRKTLVLPIHPNLRDVLDAINDFEEREFLVLTAWGKPFSPKGLMVRMRQWTKSGRDAARLHAARSAQDARQAARKAQGGDPAAHGHARARQHGARRTLQP